MTINDWDKLKKSVIAAGRGWLAMDKPAGMSVHNEPGHDLCSCVSNILKKGESDRKEIAMADPDFGVNPVHRLDKETSGILLLATSREMFRFLSDQFENGVIRKLYIAVLHGRLEKTEEKQEWGKWEWSLSKSAGGRDNPRGSKPRLPSETRYRVLDHSAHYTLAEIEPLTGRTHQIRRHAKLAGHPVVGDARYGSTRAIDYLKRNLGFDRLALHAQAITLRLPGKAAPVKLETVGIPDQMRELFDKDS